jgi:hypothetical protein
MTPNSVKKPYISPGNPMPLIKVARIIMRIRLREAFFVASGNDISDFQRRRWKQKGRKV